MATKTFNTSNHHVYQVATELQKSGFQCQVYGKTISTDADSGTLNREAIKQLRKLIRKSS